MGRVEVLIIVLAAVGALIVLALDFARGRRGRFRARRLYSIACPAHGMRVRCTMLEDDGGAVGDVAACSAFRPRGAVACEKTCVAYLNMLGRRRPQPLV